MLYDDNGISIDGPTSLSDSVDQVKRFKSRRLGVRTDRRPGPEGDRGRDHASAQKSNKPTLIACKTTIGYGAPTKAGTAKAHGEALGADELKGAKEKLGISLEPFSVPDDVLKAWREVGSRGAAAQPGMGGARWRTLSNRKRAEFDRRVIGTSARPRWRKRCKAHKKSLLETPQNIATRKSSRARDRRDGAGDADGIPARLGRSHRLDQQQGTKSARNFSAKTPKGRFIHYGIREHGMAAAMNGIFLHGGFAPSGAHLPGVHRLCAALRCGSPR